MELKYIADTITGQTIGDLIIGDLTLLRDVYCNSGITTMGGITVNGQSNINNNLTINGNITVTGNVTITGITNSVKVYKAFLTQLGGDLPQTTFGDEAIIEGRTYNISANTDNYDLTIYGAPNNNAGTSFVSNTNTSLPYTSSLVLTYNDGAPMAYVLENTFDSAPYFVYSGVGEYVAVLPNGFPDYKTSSTINNGYGPDANFSSWKPLFQSDIIYVQSAQQNPVTAIFDYADNMLGGGNNSLLEIRVYP